MSNCLGPRYFSGISNNDFTCSVFDVIELSVTVAVKRKVRGMDDHGLN
jgi:hypothetical protein